MTDAEIDRAVAERVMGWHSEEQNRVQEISECVAEGPPRTRQHFFKALWWLDEHDHPVEAGTEWHPSTDLNQAFEALARWTGLPSGPRSWEITNYGDRGGEVQLRDETISALPVNYPIAEVEDVSLPRAICLALLEAVKETTHGPS